MTVDSNQQLAMAKCNQADAINANQAFSISGGKLVQHHFENNKYSIKKVWIDSAKNSNLPAISVTPDLKAAGNNINKAIQDLMAAYVKSGFSYDSDKHTIKYNNDSGKCIIAPDGKGKLSSGDKKNLQTQFATLQLQLQGLMSVPPPQQKSSQIKKLQKQQADISAKLTADAEANQIKLGKCSTNTYQQWTSVPISSSTWRTQ